MPFDLQTYLLAALVVAGAYVVFGISAFGAALFTVPVLSHVLPLEFVLPLCVLLDVAAALAVGARLSREADRAELRWMVPFSAAGAIVGVTLLVSLPREATLAGIGAFLVAYGLYALGHGEARRLVGRAWAPLAGFIGGACGTLFGIGAPPYAIYLSHRLRDKLALRATLSNMVIFSVTIRALVFTASGLMTADRLAGFALLVPFALVGLWAGHRIQLGMSRERLLAAIAVLLVATGASLLARVLAGL